MKERKLASDGGEGVARIPSYLRDDQTRGRRREKDEESQTQRVSKFPYPVLSRILSGHCARLSKLPVHTHASLSQLCFVETGKRTLPWCEEGEER